jgi:putative membrane-bound dehydrogenase-like protein
MKRYLCLLTGWALLNLAAAAQAASFKFPTQTITVPDGFEVELVAQSPLVDRPIVADFDELGRLYIADSSGMSEKADRQLQDKPHRIVRLEDTNGDGIFDKSVVFADKMMFPEGTMWKDGSLYVSAPPSIWKLTDTNGDGVADVRVEWFQGKTLTGCANDLHGPYAGPDGWIYWTKGAFAKQVHERPGRKPIETRAAHIFRSRADGSGLEFVMTGGMDNPVDVAFTPEGERIFTTTFFQTPSGGNRDGMIHAIYGGVYGKVNAAVDDHKRTGDLMPVLTHMGPAAPCGLTRYESRVFGDDYQNNLFSCQFNLHKVQRHVLESVGGTFRTKDIDFFVSDNPDSHPTDVLEDADGSLLVIDTGGWYRICCPTSQIAKPDVLGAIYRVRRKGAPKIEDPRGLKIALGSLKPADLALFLADERTAIRQRAMDQLALAGGSAVGALNRALSAADPVARRNAVWTLTRIETSSARSAVRTALGDRDPSVQQTALHAVSLHQDKEASAKVIELLKSPSAHVRRVAAEALGRIGGKGAVPALLEAAATQQERVLEHAFIFALIEINDAATTTKGLSAASAFTRRAALVALDQMDDSTLGAESVTPLLASTNAVLRDTAAWVASHRPEWGGSLYGYFHQRLRAAKATEAEQEELQRQLTVFARNPVIQQLIAKDLGNAAVSPASHALLLRAMGQSALKEMPKMWLVELNHSLADRDPAVVRAAVSAVRSPGIPKASYQDFAPPLVRIARDPSRPDELRLDAMAALPPGIIKIDDDLMKFLTNAIAPSKPPLTRATAAGVIGRTKFNEAQLLKLAEAIKTTGPLELTKVLTAFDSLPNEAVGMKLVEGLKATKGFSVLRVDTLKPRLVKFPSSVQAAGEELLARLSADAGKQQARLDELLASVSGGDKNRGHLIFNNAKVACSTCHSIGYLGGKVGPDLTRVGNIRTERDLLEAIVFPSASFVRNYEPIVVFTKDGEERSGVIRTETDDSITLVSGLAVEQRIARADITEIRPSAVSVMPEGLDQQLSKQEMADLVALK